MAEGTEGHRGPLLQGIVIIGFGGTGYQRSLPVTSRAAYNFFNATHPVRDNGISMPEAGTQLTRQSQELMIFHDVAKALTSSLDLDSILQTIMEKMAEYFRPDTWSLLMEIFRHLFHKDGKIQLFVPFIHHQQR